MYQTVTICHFSPISGLSGNPLQDLMEAERERMRALMHQTFLQQLEHLPFAAAAMGFPFMPSMSGVQTNVGMHMSQSSPAFSTANTTTATDEVLNLSTKSKKVNRLKNPSNFTVFNEYGHIFDVFRLFRYS